MVLFLNDIATSEVILILVFVLIFFGAKSIPGLAKTLGRTIRQVKDASSEIQREIKKSSAEMKKDLNLKGIIDETANDIKQPIEKYKNDLDEAIKYEPARKSHLTEVKDVPQKSEPKTSEQENAQTQNEAPVDNPSDDVREGEKKGEIK